MEQSSSLAPQMCDVCGLDVPPDDCVKAELSVAGAMCPTPMSFHRACYEQASSMWQPDPGSICVNDPDFPETKQWERLQQEAERAAQANASS